MINVGILHLCLCECLNKYPKITSSADFFIVVPARTATEYLLFYHHNIYLYIICIIWLCNHHVPKYKFDTPHGVSYIHTALVW